MAAQNLFLDLIFSLFDLVKASFMVSLPVFLFVLVAVLVRKSLAKKYKWSWFKSSAITTYFLVFSMVFVVYSLPLFEVYTKAGPVNTPVIFFTFISTLLLTLYYTLILGVILLVISKLTGFIKKLNYSNASKILLISFLISFIFYLPNYFQILTNIFVGNVLPELVPTPLEIVVPAIVQFARLLIVALVLALVLMPLEFVGLFLFEKISQRLKIAFSLRLFATVFLASLFCWAIILFLAPWIVSGIIFLIFFGLQ